MKSNLIRGLTLFLFLAYFGQGLAQVRRASITFDEGLHQMVGYITLRTGDFRIQPVHIHPPLANMIAGAPLLLQSDLPDPRTVDGWEIASLSALADAFVWKYPNPAHIVTVGRIPILLLGVLLGAVIFRWAADYGLNAGLLALTLYAFDPNCIAHGALITTDMPATFFTVVTLFTFSRWLKRPDQHFKGLAVVGLFLGVAQLVKVSALMLAPVVGILILIQAVTNHLPRFMASHSLSDISHCLLHICRALGIVFGVAVFVIWAGYGFEIAPVSDVPFPVPAATHIKIFQSLRTHYDDGHPAFLLGRYSERGWWWYFPAAFALKTPLPVLLLAGGLLLRFVRDVLRCALRELHRPSSSCGVLYFLIRLSGFVSPLSLFPILYAFASLFSSVNIGYRHLLPVLPFMYIAMGAYSTKLVATLICRAKNRSMRFVYNAFCLVGCVLLAWLIIGTLMSAPYPMAYFNELAGGSKNGYRSLVDSNLDWGQNLWDLQRWMVEHNKSHINYAHYSPARPQVYGVAVDFLPPDPRGRDFTPWHPAPGLYAIGATVLQGPYAPEINTYAWFREREPLARLGHALFVYEVEAAPLPGWAVLCAGVSFSPEGVAQRVGADTLRVLWPDCAQTVVYPAGQQPGILIALPDVAPPPIVDIDMRLRSANGKTEYLIYRLSGVVPTPEVPVSGVEIDGPLDFLGYTLYADDVSPGDTLVLETHWRIRAVPGRLLSLMAHLLGPDGAGVAVGDSLGFPIEQWQPGDVFVQRHSLLIPADAPSGPYTLRTGAYWLDTLERWSVITMDGETDTLTISGVVLP